MLESSPNKEAKKYSQNMGPVVTGTETLKTSWPSTSIHTRPTQLQLPENVKDLGRKAKARLEETRTKRREIVRISPLDDPQASNKTLLAPTPTTVPQKHAAGKSRQRQKKRKLPATQNQFREDNRYFDRWMPRIPNGLKINKEGRSSLVHLHGIPVGTKPIQIRRFFSGLDPTRIVILPRLKNRILELDADYSMVRKKLGKHVQRCDYDVRVFVKFSNTPAADLAVLRHGEVLPTETANDTEARGASLAISQVPRYIATHLIKKMAVDAKSEVSFETSLDDLDRNFDGRLTKILWESAIGELKLVNANQRNSLPLFCRTGPNLKELDQMNIKKHRSVLQKELQSLRNQLPFPSCQIIDPVLEKDPILFLTSSASKCLEKEISRLDGLLLQKKLYAHFCLA